MGGSPKSTDELTGVFSPPPELAAEASLGGPKVDRAIDRRLRWERRRAVNASARVVLTVALLAHLGITFGDQAAWGGRLSGWEPFSFFGLLLALVVGRWRLRRSVPMSEVAGWVAVMGLAFEIRIILLTGLCVQGPEVYLTASTIICGFCVTYVDAPGRWPQRALFGLSGLGMLAAVIDPRVPVHVVAYLAVAAVFNVGMMRSLAQRQGRIDRLTRQLGQQAYVDPLTGLASRRYFDELARRWRASAEQEGLSIAVLFVDLDHFKAINDRFGHDRGDDVLVAVGEVLRGLAQGALTARYGGEEFVVLGRGADEVAAVALADRLRAEVTATVEPAVTASVGVAVCPRARQPMATLLQRADQALYRAKAGGRDCTVVG